MKKRTIATTFGLLLLLTLVFSNSTSSFGSETQGGVVFRSTGGLSWFEESGWPNEDNVSYWVSIHILYFFDEAPYDKYYYGNSIAVSKDNILGRIEEFNDEHDYATFFIYANGANYTVWGVIYCIPPGWPVDFIPVTRYALYTSYGNEYVKDEEIYYSIHGGSNLHFVFLWSCALGNEIGRFDYNYWIDQYHWYVGVGPVGMPYAWTHRDYTKMSSDGYASPDSGSYCFIGFEGFAMPMSEEIPDSGGKNYGDFVKKFYDYAIGEGFSIKQALDGASQDVFGEESFNQTSLYNGYEKYLPDPFNEIWPGKMRVYGNGNDYLPH